MCVCACVCVCVCVCVCPCVCVCVCVHSIVEGVLITYTHSQVRGPTNTRHFQVSQIEIEAKLANCYQENLNVGDGRE